MTGDQIPAIYWKSDHYKVKKRQLMKPVFSWNLNKEKEISRKKDKIIEKNTTTTRRPLCVLPRGILIPT
jgi:hypothetical protein